MFLDLHSHSTASDGRLAPEAVAAAAVAAGLAWWALTDHDTMDGIAAAEGALADVATPPRFIPGAELSTRWRDHSTHLLAYFPHFREDWRGQAAAAAWLAWLGELRQRRAERNRALLDRLAQLGIALPAERLGGGRPAASLGRNHIAQALVAAGWAGDVPEAFAKYLTPGAPAWVPLRGVETTEAIARVRAAGGLPGLAHPSRLHFDWRSHLPELASAGLMFLEAWYPTHDAATVADYRQLAAAHHLDASGGTDFHARPGEQLGADIPADELAWLAA
ncbi:MAG: PHP domain-containing protein [Terriglobales bacterium]